MDLNQIIFPAIGGALIGLSVTIMLLFNGRVTGISGILSASLAKPNQAGFWRLLFIAGLISGGILVQILKPDLFTNISDRSHTVILIAGLLVGYGTVLGSGCTSGHGVCGISRLSVRSVIATLTFMLFDFLSVQAMIFFTKGSI